MNANLLAIRVLMNPNLSEKQRQAKLSRLSQQVKDRLSNRVECPDCGDMGPHDDNGQGTMCCRACGMHHDLV